MSKRTPPPAKIRILALRSLVREQQYRVLRRCKRYTLAGAISSVANAATRGQPYSLHATFLAIQAECERLQRLEGFNEQLLLQIAGDWNKLPDGLPPNHAIVITPAFTLLLKATRPVPTRASRHRHQPAELGASTSLF